MKRRLRELPFTLADLRALIEPALNNPCVFCKATITPKTFSVDHALSIARGGSKKIVNLQVICAGCNTAKGIMNTAEFIMLLSVLNTFQDAVRKNTLARLKAGSSFYKRS